MLESIEAELGTTVPVVGASAADNSVSGDWQLCWDEAVPRGRRAGRALSRLPAGVPVSPGYVPTEYRGTITALSGREILTIDHEPAAEVYARWSGRTTLAGGSHPAETTLSPLARQVGTLDDMPITSSPPGGRDKVADCASLPILRSGSGCC